MNVLVLCADYPNLLGGKALNYVHVRNKYYLKRGITPTVLNFAAKSCYTMDGIKVITYTYYKKHLDEVRSYEWLISHAPNIKNHYVFLKRYGDLFPKLAFFFHGHEIVRVNEVYPPPYKHGKVKNKVRKAFRNRYDAFKLSTWRRFFPKVLDKSQFIFVSNVLYKDFQHYVGVNFSGSEDRVHIIPNSVGKAFEDYKYNADCEKKYDFITIRSNMDSSVYCMDLITETAERFPQYKFLVIGKGTWFENHKKPDNIIWINRVIDHEEMLDYIDKSKFAFMPTRRDSQGVMTCELLTYGIPVITSNLEICREICSDFPNHFLVENRASAIDMEAITDGYKFKSCGGGRSIMPGIQQRRRFSFWKEANCICQ